MSGYEIKQGRQFCEHLSISCTQEALCQELKRFGMEKGTVILWSMHQIVWGSWDGSNIGFLADDTECWSWQEIRVFNEEAELALRRNGEMLEGRFRKDAGEEPVEYVDTASRLWGERNAGVQDCLLLEDRERKLLLRLPAQEDSGRFYRLCTRNYIGIHEETRQAGYVDYRFVKIACERKGEWA